MASSSVIPPKEKYDVFLSFRGLDTRQTFTSHLHAALIRRRVETFIDYRLERGDEVGPALYKAIEESKIFVIIFSKDYASSTWCLDELAYILKCKEKYEQCVIPIFYEVEPTHVRHQTGTYGTAFAEHEQRPKDKVAEWKKALVEAANLSGFDSTSKTVRDDADLVEKVVSDVLAKLKREPSIDITNKVGVEGRIQKILLELDIIPEDVRVRCVVLWGAGGIGKTTLAEAVYYGLSSQFEVHYFLANVRERSGTKQAFSPQLQALRNELLGKLLGDDKLEIPTPTIDNGTISRLRRAKVLVVLDDVNNSSQLKYLAGEVPFGPGSRIIVTTRNMQPVKETLQVKNVADYDVKIYEVEELNDVESLQLLQSIAPAPFTENSQCLEKVVYYAAGIPLALEILLGILCTYNTEEQLTELWDRLKTFPNEQLRNVYTTSYDGLGTNEKEILLDLACFHKWRKLCVAKRMLAARGLFPETGILVLIDMSLISIKNDCIWMHDVIQEMAWEIVLKESPDKPEERSRLHHYDDVCSALEGNKGTANVRCISCIPYKGANQLKWVQQAFLGMHNLRFLLLSGIDHLDGVKDLGYLPDALRYLEWNEYPLQSLPSKFSPDNLVELHMPCSKLERLWGESQNLNKLKRINLSWSRDLAEVGELSNSVNIESIELQGCARLVEVPDLSKCTHIKSINLACCERLDQVPPYFKNFTKLTHLDLQRCSTLRSLPNLPGNIESLDLIGTAIEELTPSVCSLEKLRKLDLKGCSSITRFSSKPWKMRSLTDLCLRGTKIERVPLSSFSHMTEITSLDLRDCDRFISLPADICELKSLETLDLSGCSSFTTFPEIAEPLEHLRDLNFRKTNLRELPSSFGNLVGITKLNLSDCTNLESLPNSFDNLNHLEWFSLCGCVKLKELPLSFILCSLKHLDLEDCELVKEIPDCSTSFPALQSLDLSGTMIETIPSSIEKVSGLKSLRVSKCKRLQSLPVLPCLLEKLDAKGCTSLKTVSVSKTAHTQSLDEMLSDMEFNVSRTESHSFLGCVKLDETSKSNVMDDAHFRIMRMATASKKKRLARDNIAVICPGNEIPKWFSNRTPQGSSLTIKLPLHLFDDDSNFLGIALCSVFPISSVSTYRGCTCQMVLKPNNGKNHNVYLTSSDISVSAKTVETDNVLVWYESYDSTTLPNGQAQLYTEASFHFYTKVGGVKFNDVVKSCGVCFLYAQTRHVVTTKKEDEASELSKKEDEASELSKKEDEEEEDEEEDLTWFHSTDIDWYDQKSPWRNIRLQDMYSEKYNMASSSKEKCDVFLSFIGVDTRESFTSHLHAALIRRKVETYIDYRLERGDELGPAVYKAIKESKISVIIFSENYASSTWCLDELAYILECNKTHGQRVIPIFYEVEPSHVRYQTGTYKTAFAKHEQRNPDKVAKWKEALVEAANLSGFDSKVVRDDSKLVEEVVSDVLAKLNRESSIDLTRLIGAEGRIQKILLELDIIPDDVRIRYVVLWGVDGIGKTTLAEAVYHGLFSQFDAHCFLANVRERSGTEGGFSFKLHALQNKLLGIVSRLHRAKVLVVLDDVSDSSQLRYLAEEVPFGPGSRIIITTRDQQPAKDTLLHQVKDVADYDVKIHQVEMLNEVESLQLLQSHAPMHAGNSQFLHKLVNLAAGIPLALEILAKLVLQYETEKELSLLWDQLRTSGDNDLRKIYRASVDRLKTSPREIFLDLACFHKGERRCDAERIIAACGLCPDIGIKNLIDMSLIAIKDGRIWMHDLIQEMAWEAVREESPQNPGERSRLHNSEDVRIVLEARGVLEWYKGTANVQSISSMYGLLKLDPQAFTGMANLRFLKLHTYHDNYMENLECLPGALRYLDWEGYPCASLPSKFSPDNLVELHMRGSKLFWLNSRNLINLKRINLSYSFDLAAVGELSNSVNIERINLKGCASLFEYPDLSKCAYIKSINLAGCKELVQVPDLSKSVNIKSINLGGCKSLVQVPSYFQKFTKLTHLNLGSCSKISYLTEMPCNIEFLDLSGTAIEELPPSVFSLEKLLLLNLDFCSSIKNFSSIPWKMISLKYLGLRDTKIEKLPSSSFLFMTGIISLSVSGCDRLVSLPADICKLKSLEALDLSGCSRFTTFPEIAEPMEHLQDLSLSKTNLKELPSSVGNLVGLQKLDLSDCTSLKLLPDSFHNLNLLEDLSLCGCVKLKELPLSVKYLCSLIDLNLSGCELLKEIPDCFTSSTALQFLDLSGTMIETIPPSIKEVSGLKSLRVRDCKRLQSLLELPCLLERLDAKGCTRLETFSVTAHTQGLDAMPYSHAFMPKFHSFLGCVNLDEISRSRIIGEAYSRIMPSATTILKLDEGIYHNKTWVICPGNEIPKWFSCETAGSSMNIKLPLHWSDDSNFLGIALCSVWAIPSGYSGDLSNNPYYDPYKMILKTNNGETHTVYFEIGMYDSDFKSSYDLSDKVHETVETDHVLVGFQTCYISDEAKRATEASFNFIPIGGNMKKCGVCFLYAQDDDALNFEVIPPQQVTTTKERRCSSSSEDEASGS